ncbi:hypothetical protein F4678DRAFT_463178 [Xylaria arbuscula]|nr:hypothetical protein F4678DRAFT_463178 [Xylaria arbuscula]
MGEPLSWLKLVPRAQTPTSSSSSAAHLAPESKATRDPRACDASRRPGSSRRISSCTPPETEPDSVPSAEEGVVADRVVRDQDQVWYNPSLEQMVEALQVQIMTHGVLEPIPVHYNSYILHLVEGFARAQENVSKTETAYQEAKESLEHNLEEFRLVADDWLVRESQYKAEVKRLEVLLSKCSRNGLEAVTLARTNSVVDRSGSESDGFLSRLKKLRNRHIHCRHQILSYRIKEKGPELEKVTDVFPLSQVLLVRELKKLSNMCFPTAPTPKILDCEHDFRMSERFRQLDAAAKASTSRERWTQRRDNNPQSELDIKERYQDNTITRALPPPDSVIYECGLGYGDGDGDGDEATTAEAETTMAPQHERCHSGFSFETGDDYDLLYNRPEQEITAYSAHGGVKSEAVDSYQPSDDGSNESIARYTPSDELERSTEQDSPTTHSSSSDDRTKNTTTRTKAARGCRDTIIQSKQATVGAAPRRSLHSSRSASGAEQEVSQRQTGETDARIAATLAMASIFSGANQRKPSR